MLQRNNDSIFENETRKEKSVKVSFQSPRGTRDILPAEQKYWQHVRQIAENTARIFGFQRIDIPSFEQSTLFDRSIGTDTDIISKELYFLVSKESFNNRKNDSENLLALRPEFTAGIVRAYIENGMQVLPQPIKLYSIGQIFRHEKPQKGRFRDPYQFDLEILGDSSGKADAWVIFAAWTFLTKLGLKNLEVQINSLGNTDSQNQYKKKLESYYKSHLSALCPDCQTRYQKNTLRLLDCKEEQCQELKSQAPQTIDSLDESSKDHFMNVLSLLDGFCIAYNLNPFIVRGLDYYTHTAFEITLNLETKNHSGGKHQLALGGGGRYDGLAEKIGGSSTPGVGVGLGIDRIVEEIKNQNVQVNHLIQTEIFVAGVGTKAIEKARDIVLALLEANFAAEFSPDKNSFSAQLKIADKLNVIYTIIIGEKEARDDTCILRDMKSGIQEDAKIDELVSILKERLR